MRSGAFFAGLLFETKGAANLQGSERLTEALGPARAAARDLGLYAPLITFKSLSCNIKFNVNIPPRSSSSLRMIRERSLVLTREIALKL